MAIKNNLLNTIEYTDPWDGQSGETVEDAISRAIKSNENNLIAGGSYENLLLTLIRKDGSKLDPIEISVITPTYKFGIYIYGVRVNGTIIQRDLDEQIILYNKDKNFEIGIAAYATATTSNTSERNITLDVNLLYGTKMISSQVATIASKYFNIADTGGVANLIIPEGEKAESIVKWIPINELFTSTLSLGTITATLVPDLDKYTGVITDTFTTPLTILVIKLTYSGLYYTNSTAITFNLIGGNSTNYKLQGLNGSDNITSGGMLVQLNSGLNQLVVRAVHNTNNQIYTDWYYLDIICTNNCNDTVVAINKVSDNIPNNAIATLYDVLVYSKKRESCTITTYLSETDPGSNPNPSLSDLLKTLIVTKDDYNSDLIYNTTYYKYIENNNTKVTRRYLIVKVDNLFYKFNDIYDGYDGILQSDSLFKTMFLDAVNYDYCYYTNGTTYNFDLINGRLNNVFVTKEYAEAVGLPANVSESLEVTDGWEEDKGVLYFKVSAQDTPIITLLDLNLGNEFTLETKFKTYNISDESKPILTLGKMLLLPTLFGYEGDSDKRNSIFRDDTIVHLMVTVKRNFTISKDDPYYPDYMVEGNSYSGSFLEKFDLQMSSTTNSANKYNLVRIFINGVIDREYTLSDDEFAILRLSLLVVNPTTSDVNFYLLRLYNLTALDFDLVQSNYISSLMNDISNSDDNPKKDFFDKNDILNDSGIISFSKSYKKYNTILLIFPKDPINPNRTNYVPTRAWGGEDNSDPHPNDNLPVTLFINYADLTKNNKYGGRLTNTRVRGQGTSAMRYWIWNVASHITKAKKYVTGEDGVLNTSQTEKAKSKFTPYSNLDTKTNTFTSKDNVLSKYYLMPGDDDIKVTKAVGKVNYASSMQTHKIGCTDLYNAFYTNLVGTPQVGGMTLGGKKAVKEEPFLYFYTYADEYDVSNWELADVLTADALDKVKFMGFLTWGSGKGDNETYAIDSDRTPGYLLLEGGENGGIAVQFRCPWLALQRNPISWTLLDDPTHGTLGLNSVPTISYEESLERPWDRLWVSGDESIIYNPATANVSGDWDVDAGLEELARGDISEFRMDVGLDDSPNKYLRLSLKTWREFYDFVYTHDWDIIETSESDCAKWTDTTKKICCTSNSCNVVINNGVHTANDVYRYNIVDKKWVRAGVKYDINKQEWEAYNLITNVGSGNSRNLSEAKARLRQEFTNIAYSQSDAANSGTLDTIDACIHLALIRWVAGTDNRAKNTYFRVVGPVMTETPVLDDLGSPKVDDAGDPITEWVEPEDYSTNPRKYHFVGFMLDDVDTIMATDNNGLQTKLYNLLEPSYNSATEGLWGDNGRNVFFKSFDQVYELDITNYLGNLIKFSFNNDMKVDTTSNNFYKYFFNLQLTMFPAVAYNHTAKIYYELGLFVLDTKVISQFGGNDEKPIELSHGSCVESEMSFMQKRLKFLGTQSQQYTDRTSSLALNAGSGSGGGTANVKIKINYSTSQDFYPLLYQVGPSYMLDNGGVSIGNPNYTESSSIALRYLAKENSNYTANISENNSINNNLLVVDEYKTMELIGYLGDSLGVALFSHITDFKIDNANKGDYPESGFYDLTYIPNFPVAKNITLANMLLLTIMNFENCPKLEVLNLSGSITELVILPKSSHLKTVTLPKTITYFGISNNPGLSSVTFEGLTNLQTVDINCDKVGEFNVNQFCEDLVSCPSLSKVTLTNANLNISSLALDKLVLVNADINGVILINEAISFETKKKLMALYGNIDSSSNSLYIKYITELVTSFSCSPEISVYGIGDKGNPFNISITSGNDVKFVLYNGTYIPDITYVASSNISTVATLDSKTGNLTMLVDKSNIVTNVTITVNTASNTFTKTVKVSFQWVAPLLGDFVYADGTYSSAYITSKTLMGLIFTIDKTTDNSGTAYIVGKEYLDSQYVGYSNEASLGANDDRKNLYNVKFWLDNKVSGLGDSYYNTKATSNVDSDASTAITITSFNLKSPSTFTGKADTKAYVDNVNDTLLPLIVSTYPSLIKASGDSYSITSRLNLNTILTNIPNIANLNLLQMLCLLYPYFYETYLYEPEVTDSEKNSEAFLTYFSKGNWYVPSYLELAMLIYYRGYSAAGDNFSTGDIPLKSNISDSITKGSGDLKNPIFSTAYKNAGNYMPSAWNTLADSNNLCTNTDSNGHNYTYQEITLYSGSSNYYEYRWIPGTYSDNNYGYGEQGAAVNGWRLNKHKPLPCVQFKYLLK